jgi:hypothetical protein
MALPTVYYSVSYVPRLSMDTRTDISINFVEPSGYRADQGYCHAGMYSWEVPSDLALQKEWIPDGEYAQIDIVRENPYGSFKITHGNVDVAAIYSIDGNLYAIGATTAPNCQNMAYSDAQEQRKYLFGSIESSVMVSDNPEQGLLWDREDSSAAALTYRGTGRSDADVMQVVVNYCDWEHKSHLTYLYSIVSLDPEVKITEGAANLLLQVASDATNSITWQPADG